MSQSSWIAAYVLAAYLIFITARGDLPKLMKIFL